MKYNEFKKLAAEFKTVPVYKRVLADLLTPISTFMKLAKNSEYAFILESVEGGEQYARYSFIGRDPKQIIKSENNRVFTKSDGDWEEVDDEFLPFIRNVHSAYHAPKLDDLPSFTGGLVGYLGYESITWIEDIPIYDCDELDTPDAVFMLFEELIAFDHLKNQIILFSNIRVTDDLNLESAYEMALQKIDIMGENLHEDIDYQTPEVTGGSDLESNFTQQDYEKAVLTAQEHIKSGDIFQLVLSQRFKRKTDADPQTI